jgi:hypothetical protein
LIDPRGGLAVPNMSMMMVYSRNAHLVTPMTEPNLERLELLSRYFLR